MKAKVIYVAKSGQMAIVAISKPVGPVVSEIRGWMNLNQEVEAGHEFDIPAGLKVSTQQSGELVRLILS